MQLVNRTFLLVKRSPPRKVAFYAAADNLLTALDAKVVPGGNTWAALR
jgi:hypothetical protein